QPPGTPPRWSRKACAFDVPEKAPRDEVYPAGGCTRAIAGAQPGPVGPRLNATRFPNANIPSGAAVSCWREHQPWRFSMDSPPLQTWPMRPLLQDDHGRPIADMPAWKKRADAIRDKFYASTGPRPASQKLHGFTVGDPQPHQGGVTRTLVSIKVDEDDTMDAW